MERIGENMDEIGVFEGHVRDGDILKMEKERRDDMKKDYHEKFTEKDSELRKKKDKRSGQEAVVLASCDTAELMIFPSLEALKRNEDILEDFSPDSCAVMSTNFERTMKDMNISCNIHEIAFNPFSYIHSDEDVVRLSNLLLSPFRPFAVDEDYGHEESGRRFNIFLNSLIAYLYHYCDKKMQNFISVMKLMRAADISEYEPTEKNSLDLAFLAFEQQCPEDFAVQQYKVFKLNSPGIQRYIVASVAAFLSEYDFVKMEHSGQVFNTLLEEQTRNREIIGEPTTIPKVRLDDYISGPLCSTKTLGRFGNEPEKEKMKEKRVLVVDLDENTVPCTNAVFWYYANKFVKEHFEYIRYTC